MVAQFPLGMGRERKEKSNAIPVQMDAEGKIKFDSLLRQGQPKNKVIHSRFTDLVEKQIKAADDDPELARPDEEKMKEVRKMRNSSLEFCGWITQLVVGKSAFMTKILTQGEKKSVLVTYITSSFSDLSVSLNSKFCTF